MHPLAAVRSVPRRTWLRWRFAYLVLLPTLVLFIYLRVFPTAWAFVMSFFEWGLVKPAEKFVGLDNYTKLLSDKNFQTAFTNTTIFAVATTVLSVVIAIVLAAFLARAVRGRT